MNEGAKMQAVRALMADDIRLGEEDAERVASILTDRLVREHGEKQKPERIRDVSNDIYAFCFRLKKAKSDGNLGILLPLLDKDGVDMLLGEAREQVKDSLPFGSRKRPAVELPQVEEKRLRIEEEHLSPPPYEAGGQVPAVPPPTYAASLVRVIKIAQPPVPGPAQRPAPPAPPLVVDLTRDASDVLNDHQNFLASEQPHTAARSIVEGSRMPLTWEQIETLRRLETGTGLILAFARGKTLAAVLAAQAEFLKNPELEVVVVGPVMAHAGFRRAVREAGFEGNAPPYSFYEYDTFKTAWQSKLLRQANTFVIFDEAHRLRRQVYRSLRLQRDNIPKEHWSAVQRALDSAEQRHEVDLLSHVKCISGFDITHLASAPLAAITFAMRCHKTLLLTSTPIMESKEDVLNLVAVALKRGVVSPTVARVVFADPDAVPDTNYPLRASLRADYPKGLFLFDRSRAQDVQGRLPGFEVELVNMTAECYRSYPKYSWGGILEELYCGNAQDSNKHGKKLKADFIMREVVSAERDRKIVIHSMSKASFVQGFAYLQEELSRRGIEWREINAKMDKPALESSVESFNDPWSNANVIFTTESGWEGVELKNVTRVYILDGRKPTHGNHLTPLSQDGTGRPSCTSTTDCEGQENGPPQY